MHCPPGRSRRQSRVRSHSLGVPPPPCATQVKALASSPQYAQLAELVGIFAHGQLDAFKAFADKNGAFLAELGVDLEKRCVGGQRAA